MQQSQLKQNPKKMDVPSATYLAIGFERIDSHFNELAELSHQNNSKYLIQSEPSKLVIHPKISQLHPNHPTISSSEHFDTLNEIGDDYDDLEFKQQEI